jgi:hypothetical protein
VEPLREPNEAVSQTVFVRDGLKNEMVIAAVLNRRNRNSYALSSNTIPMSRQD